MGVYINVEFRGGDGSIRARADGFFNGRVGYP